MYQCIIPPRIFLAVGVGLLIFSLVLGWISFSVPDWLQFYERNGIKNNSTENNLQTDNIIDLKKFGLWYKCTFSTNLNDFICTLWNNDAPSFVRVAQVLIPFGLTLGCLAFLSAIIGFMSRRAFVTTVLFSALFAFLSFIFTTIGVTVFATESLVYVERLRLNNNDNCRRWGMWLIIPNLALAFMASLCFILASIFNWCDYRSMRVTGILNHSADKYGGSVFKAPSDSNMTSLLKKQQSYLHQTPISGHDYPNTCYQISGSHVNQNPLGYPPPPSYGAPMHQHGGTGPFNPGFQTAPGFQTPTGFQTPPGLFGYSRPSSPINPIYPHQNHDSSYHHRHYMTENSEMDDLSRVSRSHRRSRSRRHSGHRSRSHSSQESPTNANNPQENNVKQPQFIPIPVPYYHLPTQPTSSQPTTQTSNASTNNNNNNTQPVSYVIQQPKQHYIEEIIKPTVKATNMLTYGSGQPLMVSNPSQPVYTIAYRTNNGNVLASNILTGPAATTYVTASRNQFTEIRSLNSDSEDEDKVYQSTSRQHSSKKINKNETWAWRKL